MRITRGDYVNQTLHMASNPNICSGKNVKVGSSVPMLKYKWAHPTWVDIPEFLKYLRSVARGEQFHLLNDIVYQYQKQWKEIVQYNSVKMCDKLIDVLKEFHINHSFVKMSRKMRDVKFKAQALDDIFHLPSSAKDACDALAASATSITTASHIMVDSVRRTTELTNDFVEAVSGINVDDINQTLKNVKETSVNVKSFTEQFSQVYQNLLEKMQGSFSNSESSYFSWLGPIIIFVVKIFSMCYLLKQKQNQTFSNIVAILTLALPSNVSGNLEFISNLTRAIKGVLGYTQAQGEDDCFILTFANMMKDVMSGLFSKIDRAAFDTMSFSGKKVKILADFLKNASTITDFFVKLLTTIFEWIGDRLFSYYGILPWFMKENKISALVTRFVDIKEKRLDSLAKTSRHAAQTIAQLYIDVLKQEAEFAKQKNLPRELYIKVVPYVRIMSKALETMMTFIPEHLLSGKDMRRTKPFWIYIYGAPRIGKSAMFQPYLINALARELKIREEYEDYTNYTYFRNCGDKYWEKYSNHPVLWYNDLFQNYTDEEAMQLAIVELTNVVDDSLYPLNMAFSEKHGVYFNSEIVISNAQDDIIGKSFIANKCLSNGTHINARRNIVVEFQLQQAYARDGGAGIDYAKMGASTSRKVGNLFPNDMYNLVFRDPESGQIIAERQFEEGVQYIIDSAKMFKSSQGEFKDQLYDHFKRLWAQAGDNMTIVDNGDEIEDRNLVDLIQNLMYLRNNQVSQRSQRLPSQVLIEDVVRDGDDIYFDAFDASDLLNRFTTAVHQFAPEWLDNPIINEIRDVQYDHSTNLLRAMADFIVRSDVDGVATDIHIMTVVEIAGLESWARFYEERQHRSFWKRVDLYISKWLDKIVPIVVEFIQNHPILCGVGAFLMYLKLLTMWANYWLPPDPIVAQTSEGDRKMSTRQIKREKKIIVGKSQSYDEQNTVVEHRINSQMAKFSLLVKNGDIEVENRVFGTGLGIGSDVFVLPAHFWHRWCEMRDFYKTHNYECVLQLHWSNTQVVNIPWDVIRVWLPSYAHLGDVVFLRFVKLIQLKNLNKFFVRANDTPELYESYLYGFRGLDFVPSSISVNKTEIVMNVRYTHESRQEKYFGGVFSQKEIHIPMCYKYANCTTNGGDCGMILLNTDGRLNCRKIMGIHVAGNTRNSLGIANAIFQEDIEEAFSVLYTLDTPITMFEPSLVEELVSQDGDVDNLKQSGVSVMGIKKRYVNEEFNIDKNFKLTSPRKTAIAHSVVYDIMEEDFGVSCVAPATLRPFVREGVTFSPLFMGISKMACVSNMVSKQESALVKNHMLLSLRSWQTSYSHMEVLSDFDTVNGYGLMKAVDMSTSAGFPYVIINNTSGKLPFFEEYVVNGSKKFRMRSFVQSEFDDRESKAKTLFVKETYFIDTLKDETRLLDKVLSGKTRVFQVAPVDLNLLIRKYFGTFISFCHSTYLTGEMAVGINANSYDWTIMFKSLVSNSDVFINGDGKNFDASLGQQYMMEIVEVINEFYNDGNVNANVRRTIFATILNSHHIVGNVVYVAKQGNKSGIALTTIFNNLAGMFAIRLAYLRFAKTLSHFELHVSCKFYGDDDLISVKKLINSDGIKFDSLYYKTVWADLGVEYTSAHKDQELKSYYDQKDLTFLQRAFVPDPTYSILLPQLNMAVIREISRWSESNPNNMEDQLNRFNSTLLELSNYSREKFDKYYNHFVEYCSILLDYNLIIKPTRLFTYDLCKKMLFPQIYGHSSIKVACDLTVTPDKSGGVLCD